MKHILSILICMATLAGVAVSQDRTDSWIDEMKGVNVNALSREELAEKERQLTEAWRGLVAQGRPAARRIRQELETTQDDAYFQLSASVVLHLIERERAHPEIIKVLDKTSLSDHAYNYFYLCHRLARSGNAEILPVLERILANNRVVVFVDADTILEPQVAATFLYGVYGPGATPALLEATRSENAVVRANTAAVLGYFAHETALFVLADLLAEDPDEHVRANAANAMGLIDHPAAIRPLADVFVREANVNVRATAAFALGEIRSINTVEPLALALNDIARPVREMAINSFAYSGNPQGATYLANRLAIENEADLRLEIIRAIGRIGSRDSIPALRAHSKARDGAEAVAAEEVIKRIEVVGPRKDDPYPGLEGKELTESQLQRLLQTLTEQHGVGLDEHAKTILVSAKRETLPALEGLRRSTAGLVNSGSFDRMNEASRLIRLVRRKLRGTL